MRPTKIIGPIQIYQTEPLGSGSTANVFRGKLKNSTSPQLQNQHEIAVKVIPHHQRFENEVTQYLFESQKEALTTMNHPYVVKCFGIYEDGRSSYLAMQFLKGGSLKEHMTQKGKMPQKQAVCLFKKLLQVVSYISSKGFVHRDLKPANIMLKQLIDENTKQLTLQPVIIDFGFAQRTNCLWKPQMFYNVGSPSYMAPEAYNFTKYSEKSDLWALGVIFYEMLSGEAFDQGLNVDELFNFTVQVVERRLMDKRMIFSIRSMKILRAVFMANENARGTIQDILKLVKKLQNQLETYNLIKKKKSQTIKLNQKQSLKNVPSVKQSLKRNLFFQMKNARSKLKIPAFLDKTKNTQKVSTLEKTITHLSPRPNACLISQQQSMVKTVKSQELIRTSSPQVYKFTQSTVVEPLKQKALEFQRNVSHRRNTHIMSVSVANSASLTNINILPKNPQTNSFNRLYFNYKPATSGSFHHYVSPPQSNLHKEVRFIVKTGI